MHRIAQLSQTSREGNQVTDNGNKRIMLHVMRWRAQIQMHRIAPHAHLRVGAYPHYEVAWQLNNVGKLLVDMCQRAPPRDDVADPTEK